MSALRESQHLYIMISNWVLIQSLLSVNNALFTFTGFKKNVKNRLVVKEDENWTKGGSHEKNRNKILNDGNTF